MGRLQVEFLTGRGLSPSDVLVDVGCGALRGGVPLIRYLNPGHYLGIDKDRRLIRAGLQKELPADVRRLESPEFVVSDSFEFHRFTRRPTYGIAQSLFTHLPEPMIRDCLIKLRKVATPGCRFYATYFEGCPAENDRRPHDLRAFRYRRSQMAHFAKDAGWSFTYIGECEHPRGQVITEHVAAP